jgi:hypothetical protein
MRERTSARSRADAHLNPLTIRVDDELLAALRKDADQLDLTLADICRFRLRSGRAPTVLDRLQTETTR